MKRWIVLGPNDCAVFIFKISFSWIPNMPDSGTEISIED
jgi:hypothetical protein